MFAYAISFPRCYVTHLRWRSPVLIRHGLLFYIFSFFLLFFCFYYHVQILEPEETEEPEGETEEPEGETEEPEDPEETEEPEEPEEPEETEEPEGTDEPEEAEV